MALDSASSPLALGCGFHWNLNCPPTKSQPQKRHEKWPAEIMASVQHLPVVNEIMDNYGMFPCFQKSSDFLINHDRSQLPAHCAQLRTARITEASCHPPSSIWAFSAWGTTMMHDSNTTGNTADLGRPRSQAEAMDGLGCGIHGFSMDSPSILH